MSRRTLTEAQWARIEGHLPGREGLPGRSGADNRRPPVDPDLYAERHKVENFFQRIKRFRRIALRCEKTIPSFMGFVFLVSALDWLR